VKEHLTRTNVVLTLKLRDKLQKEANKKCAGNISLLLRLLLATRYDLPNEIEPQFQCMLEDIE
jgi:hypothetical protein